MSPHCAALQSRVATFLFTLGLALVSFSPHVHAASAADVAPPAAVGLSASEPTRISSDIPLRRDTTPDAANAASTVWPTMVVLLGLAGLVVWTVRRKRLHKSSAPSALGLKQNHPVWPAPLGRWLSGDTTEPVQVLSNQRLTPRHSVHLIQWRGRTYLLGCGETHITVIDSAAAAEGTDQPEDPSKP